MTCVFSLFIFVNRGRGLSILFFSAKNQIFVSLISPIVLHLNFIDFCSYLYFSFLMLSLGLFCAKKERERNIDV